MGSRGRAGENDFVGRMTAFVCDYASYAAICAVDLLHFYSTCQLDVELLQLGCQRIGDSVGLVRHRKNSISIGSVAGDTDFGKECDQRLVVELSERRNHELASAAEAGNKLFVAQRIGYIAASAAAGTQLGARPFCFSSSSTRQPRRAAVIAASIPAAPAPITIRSYFIQIFSNYLSAAGFRLSYLLQGNFFAVENI